MSFWEENWRKPVGKTVRQKLLGKQNGKCARCRKSFSTMRVKPVLHHTRKSNQLRSMQLLCPNCHSKAHVIKKTEDVWGGITTVVKRKKFGVRNEPKKKRKNRRSSIWSLFWIPAPKVKKGKWEKEKGNQGKIEEASISPSKPLWPVDSWRKREIRRRMSVVGDISDTLR